VHLETTFSSKGVLSLFSVIILPPISFLLLNKAIAPLMKTSVLIKPKTDIVEKGTGFHSEDKSHLF
jgi:hypothetical protein